MGSGSTEYIWAKHGSRRRAVDMREEPLSSTDFERHMVPRDGWIGVEIWRSPRTQNHKPDLDPHRGP